MSPPADLVSSAKPGPRMTLELVVVPVSDADRAKHFYGALGWRLDIDFSDGQGFRIVQFTPPGSNTSIMFGEGISAAAPGSLQGLHLIVADVVAVREDLLQRGVAVSELFHDAGGIFHHVQPGRLTAGPNPQRKSYASYASFSDPDGNGWIIQEVTTRLSGPLPNGDTAFTPQLSDAVGRLP